MREVAARAGVSIATVSFVVNGTKAVSEPTRRAVTEAMQELGYRNNVVARALASKRTRIVALLFPADVQRLSRIALEIFMSAATRASELGYHLVLWPTGTSPDDVSDLVSGRLVDGVIVMEGAWTTRASASSRRSRCRSSPSGARRTRTTCRSSTWTSSAPSPTGSTICRPSGTAGSGSWWRTSSAGRCADTGRRRAPSGRSCRRRRRAGSAAPWPDARRRRWGEREAAGELLAADPGITAVMLLNDQAARGLISGLDAAGRRVPEDVSILSLASSTEVGALVEPALSTMDAPGPELGRLAVEMLLARLDGTATELPHALLPCLLHVAASTGPAPAAR